MTARTASAPPFPFGSADLRANARRFFERALLLSAVVHLSVVLAVRAANERLQTPVEEKGIPEHVTTLEVIVRVPPPLDPALPGASQAKDGTITPRAGDDPLVIDVSKPSGPDPSAGATSSDKGTSDALTTIRNGDPKILPGEFRHVETQPVPVQAPIPPYPDWMREAQIEGRVLLKILVGTDGLPKQFVIVSGSKVLGEEASKTLMRWKFRPGTSNGKPVEVWTEIPVNYRLER